jgi:hypothetical protein
LWPAELICVWGTFKYLINCSTWTWCHTLDAFWLARK